VPYRGSAPAVQDVLGKRVAAMVMPIHTALPLAAEGRVRMLAVGSTHRLPSAPDVPSFAEAGFPAVEIGLWYPLLGPAGMAPALVRRLNAVLNEWLALPATQAQLRQQGMTPVGGMPDVLATRIERDLARWTRVVRTANIRAE
jgi:tripartite-type tricarboxylate transporter receptor subunit TctC